MEVLGVTVNEMGVADDMRLHRYILKKIYNHCSAISGGCCTKLHSGIAGYSGDILWW